MRRSAEHERKFFDKPYEISDNLSHAIEWAHIFFDKIKRSYNTQIISHQKRTELKMLIFKTEYYVYKKTLPKSCLNRSQHNVKHSINVNKRTG